MAEPVKKRAPKKAAAKKKTIEDVISDSLEEPMLDENVAEVRASEEDDSDEESDERITYPVQVRREERLQKIIASAGVTSRRKAEELITERRVQVNGTTITELGSKADPALDHIRVDGKLIVKPGGAGHRLRYAVLNKPKGYITSANDPEGRPTVMEFFPGGTRVFPVGRLDYQSEGLLLMTNDGELANLLTRAANKVQKVYLVKISRKPSDEALNQLRAGIMIDKGRNKDEKLGRVLTQPAGIRRVRDADNPWYEVTLTEGRNREIRKMFEEVGHFVEKIRRVGFGPLVLDIPPGEVRELTPDEVLSLQRAARGIRSVSRVAIPPVSVPPIRRKAKHGNGISRPGAKPVSQPILSEWPTKPANRPAPRPTSYERTASPGRTGTSARPSASGSSVGSRPASSRPLNDRSSSIRPSGGRPSGGKSSSDRPFSSRSFEPRTSTARPASAHSASDRPASGRPSGTRPTTGGAAFKSGSSSSDSSFKARPAFKGRPTVDRTSGDSPSSGRSFGGKPFSERPAKALRPTGRPTPRPVAFDLPDEPETPSFGITITREPASVSRSYDERPKGRKPTSSRPYSPRPGGGRAAGRPTAGGKPASTRPYSGGTAGGRSSGNRPPGNRPTSSRPSDAGRPPSRTTRPPKSS